MHQRKGTIAAVHRAVGYHGFTAEVAEWWDTGDPRGTFRLEVDVNETGHDGKVLTELERWRTKPVSRHISLSRSPPVQTVPLSGRGITARRYCDGLPAAHSAAENLRYLGITHFDGNYHFSGDDDD
jgi:P2-related tail formation protein